MSSPSLPASLPVYSSSSSSRSSSSSSSSSASAGSSVSAPSSSSSSSAMTISSVAGTVFIPAAKPAGEQAHQMNASVLSFSSNPMDDIESALMQDDEKPITEQDIAKDIENDKAKLQKKYDLATRRPEPSKEQKARSLKVLARSAGRATAILAAESSFESNMACFKNLEKEPVKASFGRKVVNGIKAMGNAVAGFVATRIEGFLKGLRFFAESAKHAVATVALTGATLVTGTLCAFTLNYGVTTTQVSQVASQLKKSALKTAKHVLGGTLATMGGIVGGQSLSNKAQLKFGRVDTSSNTASKEISYSGAVMKAKAALFPQERERLLSDLLTLENNYLTLVEEQKIFNQLVSPREELLGIPADAEEKAFQKEILEKSRLQKTLYNQNINALGYLIEKKKAALVSFGGSLPTAKTSISAEQQNQAFQRALKKDNDILGYTPLFKEECQASANAKMAKEQLRIEQEKKATKQAEDFARADQVQPKAAPQKQSGNNILGHSIDENAFASPASKAPKVLHPAVVADKAKQAQAAQAADDEDEGEKFIEPKSTPGTRRNSI